MSNLIGSPFSEYPALFTSEKNKMALSFLYVKKEERLSNKRSRRARQHQKRNKIWQSSIKRYVFLLFFSGKCTQDVFRNVLFTNDEWATSRHLVKLQKFQTNIYVKTILRGIC